LSLYLIFAEYDCEAFDATSDEIRVMAFYQNPDFINLSLKHDFRHWKKFV